MPTTLPLSKSLGDFLRGRAARSNGPRRGGLYAVSADLRGQPPAEPPPEGAGAIDLRVWAEGRARPGRAADATLAAAHAAVERVGGADELAAILRRARAALAAGEAGAFPGLVEAAYFEIEALSSGGQPSKDGAARRHAQAAAWSALRQLVVATAASPEPMVAFGESLNALQAAGTALGALRVEGAEGRVAAAFRDALLAP